MTVTDARIGPSSSFSAPGTATCTTALSQIQALCSTTNTPGACYLSTLPNLVSTDTPGLPTPVACCDAGSPISSFCILTKNITIQYFCDCVISHTGASPPPINPPPSKPSPPWPPIAPKSYTTSVKGSGNFNFTCTSGYVNVCGFNIVPYFPPATSDATDTVIAPLAQSSCRPYCPRSAATNCVQDYTLLPAQGVRSLLVPYNVTTAVQAVRSTPGVAGAAAYGSLCENISQ